MEDVLRWLHYQSHRTPLICLIVSHMSWDEVREDNMFLLYDEVNSKVRVCY